MADYFQYGEEEIAYLRHADQQLAEVIDKIGMVRRQVVPDLFAALVFSIVGQQISMKAQETIWQRMSAGLGKVTPETIMRLTPEELQSFGISFRKATYIQNAARKIVSGEFGISALNSMNDDEVCAELTKLDGIGVWSAEMLMLFSMQRPNILSYGDLAIQRGLRMVYHHREISRKLFERYRKRFSPYCSVASIYLWAVAGGAIPEMKDDAIKNKTNGTKR
ncbi:MAG: DNA-3-methyladenine glycosylase 2 family protein [Prevotella sp.]|nr:DNA-3-methyladenine glycosylase 2 family protein [Prevotella sp.]